MKNYEIVSILEAYEKLKSSAEDGPTLPAAVAWKRRLNFRKLLEARSIIDEALNDVGKKYSDDEHSVDEDGKRKVKDEYVNDFVNDRYEILNQETDVDIKKIKIEDLGEIVLSEKDMDTLEFMIEE